VTRTIKWLLCFCLLCFPTTILAQEQGNDDPSFTDNLGLTMSVPLNPTSTYTDFGFGVDFGAGYNFTRRHAIIGETSWNYLYASSSALQSLRQLLQTPDVSGHGKLFTVTANYRFELRGQLLGTYFIAGTGLYHRSAEISKAIPVGTTCVNLLVTWWGYSCTPGVAITNLTLANSYSNALGVNGGIGFTVRVGEAPYRFYIETRYHYAPSKGVNTQLATVTVGFRY
jgi:hypothetical protein